MTINKTRIITGPSVYHVGSTKFNPVGFDAFIEGEGLGDILDDPTSPLSRISDIVHGISHDFTHEEIMPEFGGRFCYESWAKGRLTDDYNANILDQRHGSVTEHTFINFVVTGVSRSLTHELIRHRAGVAISELSQRFVNSENACFVMPPILLHYLGGDIGCGEALEWLGARQAEMEDYCKWRDFLLAEIEGDDDLDDKRVTVRRKRAMEAARSSLPNATETKALWSCNVRSLRHVSELRGFNDADLEFRRLASTLAAFGKSIVPTLFHDVEIIDGDFGVPEVVTQHRKV